ncbi:hypothetical protein CLOM_g2747 [Closterium sp. NIES-68]|nr:hypothetical protein CLOM_g2747 [Closterium sp. NIES-68]GJP67896.1 hypothetical protein CLOP_g24654 [Closterium sp. NIES-67]
MFTSTTRRQPGGSGPPGGRHRGLLTLNSTFSASVPSGASSSSSAASFFSWLPFVNVTSYRRVSTSSTSAPGPLRSPGRSTGGGGGGGGGGSFRLSMPGVVGGDVAGTADKRRGGVAVCCVLLLLLIALVSGGGSAIWDAFSSGPSYVSLSATADPASLRAERVFTQPPWRIRDGSEAGYLYGWTGPALAYRMAWKQPASHGGSAGSGGGAGGAVSADDFAQAMRVGGVLRRVGVSTVAASGHTLAVTPGGVVLSWGRDWDARRRPAGLLGRADGAFWRPAPVEGLTGEGQVVAVATGQYHSVAVMESGRVFTWGLNNRGQLGRPTKSKEEGFRPGLVGGPLSHERILAIVAGRYFTLAISQHGRLFTWGANLYTGDAPWQHEYDSGFDDDAADGSGGDGSGTSSSSGDSSSRAAWRQRLLNAALAAAQPRVVEAGVESEQIVEVDVGTDHWVALTGSGIVLVCSTGFSPQGIRINLEQHRSWLGVGPSAPLDRPAPVRVPPHLGSHPGGAGGGEGGGSGPEVQSVAAAHHTTFAVTSDYKAVSWGEPGPLLGREWGEGEKQVPASRPGVVGNGLEQQTVEQVSAGEGFAVARMSHGVVYSWGDNQHGQLGRPAAAQDPTPAPVQGLAHLEVLLVVAGSQQGLVLCRALQGSDSDLEAQEFDDTKLLNEEHVSPALLPDPDAAVLPAAAGGAAAAAVVGGDSGGAVGGGMGPGGVDGSESVGAASGAIGGGVARDMWFKFGEEFKLLPRDGMDGSMRNPCWRVQGNAGEVHCLPYFLIIGATRAGTQDLYRKLTSSIIPGIFPAAIPNPQWWDRNGAKDFAWYVSLFDEAAQHIVNTGGSGVTGEASSTLLTSSGVVLRGRVDERHTVPQLLHLVLPRSKFIVILRNPVDRFFSEFNLAAAVNPSPAVPRDFVKYSRDATARMRACVEIEGVHACVRKLFRDMPDLCGSMYSYFIQDWFRSFHPQSFLFLRFEDYMANPRPHIATTLDFLGFPPADIAEEQWAGVIDLERVEQRPEGMQREEMDEATREYLEAFFAPYNEDLVRLLKDEKYAWKRERR